MAYPVRNPLLYRIFVHQGGVQGIAVVQLEPLKLLIERRWAPQVERLTKGGSVHQLDRSLIQQEWE